MTREECIALLERYAEYNGMGIPNLAGCREAMKMAADLLSHPSLPSDLDEAEFEYVQSLDEIPANQEEEKMIYDAFKAGAEWMAGQGETIEGEVVKTNKNNLVVLARGLSGKNAVFGDKVIAQIRKKQ